jgi:hypothetical protein
VLLHASSQFSHGICFWYVWGWKARIIILISGFCVVFITCLLKGHD